MSKWKSGLFFVILGLLLSGNVILALSRTDQHPVQAKLTEVFSSRTQIIQAASTQTNLFDCANYHPTEDVVSPIETQILSAIHELRITPDDGKDYRGGIWSPDGVAIAFVAPTDESRLIQDHDILPSDEDTRLVAISKNELLLYYPERNIWKPITRDGAHPVWNTDGHTIYYMSGVDLIQFDPENKTTRHTGLQAPNTGNGLLFSQPLSDGRLFAPRQPHAPLEIQGGFTSLGPIEVTENDYVLLAPDADKAIVAYGANTWKGKFSPSITVLYHQEKGPIPLFKNCQYSALEAVWSPNSRQIAYPVHANQPEIRLYDVESGQVKILIRLNNFEHISGLSWSPDGRFLAFTRGDGRFQPRSIWVVSTDGSKQQHLIDDGLMPNWSPDGQYILYARPVNHQMLSWYLLQVSTTEAQSRWKSEQV